jgi:hypothetical protein
MFNLLAANPSSEVSKVLLVQRGRERETYEIAFDLPVSGHSGGRWGSAVLRTEDYAGVGEGSSHWQLSHNSHTRSILSSGGGVRRLSIIGADTRSKVSKVRLVQRDRERGAYRVASR